MKTTKKKPKPIKVKVTAKQIKDGKAGDCFRCPVALALTKATGDDHANVYARDWALHLEVHSRHIIAPVEVATFVSDFDADDEGLEPFEFELPPFDDPEWQERCYGCEELFDGKELDDEGNCRECKAEQEPDHA